MTIRTVYISLGSNSGRREWMLGNAYNLISAHIAVPERRSGIYETAAWGNPDQPPFLNAVLSLQAGSEPLFLLKKMLAIEKEMGRERGPGRWTERCIDLDILFCDTLSVSTPELQIPHPEIRKRRFVLEPLAEIAPDYIHPEYGETIRMLLDRCTDPLKVTRLTGPDWEPTGAIR